MVEQERCSEVCTNVCCDHERQHPTSLLSYDAARATTASAVASVATDVEDVKIVLYEQGGKTCYQFKNKGHQRKWKGQILGKAFGNKCEVSYDGVALGNMREWDYGLGCSFIKDMERFMHIINEKFKPNEIDDQREGKSIPVEDRAVSEPVISKGKGFVVDDRSNLSPCCSRFVDASEPHG